MDKETILKMSREENEGQQDEWEQSVEGQAAKISRAVGLAVCMILVFVAESLQSRYLGWGAWITFFAMEGSSNLYIYLKTKKRSKLVWAVLELLCTVCYMIIMTLWTVL